MATKSKKSKKKKPRTKVTTQSKPQASSTTQATSTQQTTSAQQTTKSEEDTSFATMIYNEIASAIGGNNKDQFLCLQIPGTTILANDYKYEYEKGEPKPPIVEANESRLANKMFDPCRITGSDNGLSLPYQYKSALDMLTPKLNKNIADYKNKLRQLLLSDYPYDFGKGIEKGYTLQEVYFRLYEDYIAELDAWSNLKKQKKEEFKSTFSFERKSAYLEWYENEAEKHLNIINEKKAKILSILSPTDMKILEGVLDSGTGAELQEARQALNGVRKLTPNGSYVYPVRFNPPNWFEMLGTSFTPTDMAKSTEAIASDIQTYSIRRMQLYSYIEDIAALISNSRITPLLKRVDTVKKQMEKALTKVASVYGENARDYVVKSPFADIQPFLKRSVSMQLVQRLAQNARLQEQSKMDDAQLAVRINRDIRTNINQRNRYVTAIKKLEEGIRLEIAEKNLENIQSYLDPITKQIELFNEKITELQKQLSLSSCIEANTKNAPLSTSVVPPGFTNIVIDSNMESIEKQTEYTISNSTYKQGANYLFNSTSTQTSNSSIFNSELFKTCKIHIGMNIAKVGIEREWFNPGVFALTRDMFKLGTAMISPASDNYDGVTEQRLQDMRKCIFPCYPVAIIIARDITITFEFTGKEKKDIMTEYRAIEKQASSGRGFLIFQNATENSFSQQTNTSTQIHENTVTVRIDSTQLFGYFLEATQADQSIPFESMSNEMRENEQVSSISEFVETYKSILKDKGQSSDKNETPKKTEISENMTYEETNTENDEPMESSSIADNSVL